MILADVEIESVHRGVGRHRETKETSCIRLVARSARRCAHRLDHGRRRAPRSPTTGHDTASTHEQPQGFVTLGLCVNGAGATLLQTVGDCEQRHPGRLDHLRGTDSDIGPESDLRARTTPESVTLGSWVNRAGATSYKRSGKGSRDTRVRSIGYKHRLAGYPKRGAEAARSDRNPSRPWSPAAGPGNRRPAVSWTSVTVMSAQIGPYRVDREGQRRGSG
jgi:hypothetical protein